VCDTWLAKITDAKEETTIDPQTGSEAYVDEEYGLAGIHTHGDGVIHYHPFSTRSVGKRARLGVFLDVYDIELSETRLDLTSIGDKVYDIDDGFQCGGEDAVIKVVAWDNFTDTGNGQTYITDLPDVALRNDGMVFVVAVVPAGDEVPMPDWAADLPALGAADSGNVPQTTVDGESDTATTVTGDTTPTTGSAPTDSAPTASAPTDSAPADTAVPATAASATEPADTTTATG
jgi:hypothetical protein